MSDRTVPIPMMSVSAVVVAQRVRDGNVKQAINLASTGEVKVAFLNDDWALNSQAFFGSGSIPNE